MLDPSNFEVNPKTGRSPAMCSMIYFSSWFGVMAITLLTAFYLPILIGHLPIFEARESLYKPAWFVYDEENTLFDNSAWTYVTDYMLAVFMGFGAFTTYLCSPSTLRDRTCGLLTCMCISVTVGGMCHQFFTGGVPSLNRLDFRILWSVCVGTVTMAGGYIGSCGSHLSRLSRDQFKHNKRFHVFVVPDWFWVLWGVSLTALCVAGGMSMKRPAADIFIAGITQTPPSIYIFVVAISNTWHPSVVHAKRMLWIAFFFNAPLLPLYPVLVMIQQDNGLTLGFVNATLHFWLCLAWGMQFIALNKFCRQLYGPAGDTSTGAAAGGGVRTRSKAQREGGSAKKQK
jgi:hypothetical protein